MAIFDPPFSILDSANALVVCLSYTSVSSTLRGAACNIPLVQLAPLHEFFEPEFFERVFVWPAGSLMSSG